MANVTKKQQKINTRQKAISTLHSMIQPNDTIYTKLDHVSRSGMMRHISLYIIHDGRIFNITHWAERALNMRQADDGGIKIGGCGSDMGFELVYALGYAMWPESTDKPHGTRNGEPDSNGGYAFKHQWL